MNTKRILGWVVVWLFSAMYINVSAANIDTITNKPWIEKISNPSYETSYPEWAKPDAEYANTDLWYWVYDVLPYAQDRNKSAYLIYPKQGIIIPVTTLNQEDRNSIAWWNWFDHFPYLQKSALHYVGKSPSQGMSNMVVAAHSSFDSSDAGRYKTAFQSVIYTNVWDKIWYFEKNGETYDRYEYTVKESTQTSTTNTSIIKEVEWKTLLTAYTCYPIGTSDARWYNRAELTNTERWFTLQQPLKPEPIIETLPVIQEKVHAVAEVIQDKKPSQDVNQITHPAEELKTTIQTTLAATETDLASTNLRQVSVYGEQILSIQKSETEWSVAITSENPIETKETQTESDSQQCEQNQCINIEQKPAYNPIYGIFTTNFKKIVSPFFG